NHDDPVTVLSSLNDALVASGTDPGGERFCTVVFGIFTTTDADGVQLTVGSGGHPYPMVRHADGTVDEVRLGGALIGVFPSAQLAVAQVHLTEDDTLVLVTDGVLEARDGTGEMFDTAGLQRVLAD